MWQLWFFSLPTDAELPAMPFICRKNIGLYTSVSLCVLEEKQDQSPSPLCVVIKLTAGSSHYAIRASKQTWSVALHLTLVLTIFFLCSAPVHCKETVCLTEQACSKQTGGFESVCCETLWCNTSSPLASAYFFTVCLTDCFSAKPGGENVHTWFWVQ